MGCCRHFTYSLLASMRLKSSRQAFRAAAWSSAAHLLILLGHMPQVLLLQEIKAGCMTRNGQQLRC